MLLLARTALRISAVDLRGGSVKFRGWASLPVKRQLRRSEGREVVYSVHMAVDGLHYKEMKV